MRSSAVEYPNIVAAANLGGSVLTGIMGILLVSSHDSLDSDSTRCRSLEIASTWSGDGDLQQRHPFHLFT
jgi:hypothetical protein